MQATRVKLIDPSRENPDYTNSAPYQTSPSTVIISTPADHDKKWYSGLMTWKCIALVLAFCLIIMTIANLILICQYAGSTVVPEVPGSTTDVVPTDLRIVSRAEWGAQPPKAPLEKMTTPVPYVIISHTATDLCHTQLECTFRVRSIQSYHMESRNWLDIAYNFLVGGDGYVYMGRGWDSVGAHSHGYNNRSIGIAFIGNFDTAAPSELQLTAAQRLMDYGVREGKISPNFILLGERQIANTLSPGDGVYNIIKKWPHWSLKP